MPKQSEREILLRDLDGFIRTLCIYGEENSNLFNEILQIYAELDATRYLNSRETIPKSDGLMRLMLQF